MSNRDSYDSELGFNFRFLKFLVLLEDKQILGVGALFNLKIFYALYYLIFALTIIKLEF